MSDPRDDGADLAEPLRRQPMFDAPGDAPNDQLPALMQPMVIQMTSRDFTAKKVAVPRNLKKILADLRTLCAQWGSTYVWSWEVYNRELGRKELIEGGTIKLANDLVGIWGNCSVECEVNETATHWIFKAWFMDAERGVATSRLFQQRKSQNVGGRMDGGRAADMIFQIGQSKAIRNVVLNALPSLSNEAIEESKRAIIDMFKDPENAKKANAFIDRVMADKQIGIKRVEATVGRVRPDWTVRDMAKVYMEMRGLYEGMTVADEIYPSEEKADQVNEARRKKEAERTGDQSKPAPDGKKEETVKGPAAQTSGQHVDTGPGAGAQQAPAVAGAEGAPAAAKADVPKPKEAIDNLAF